MVHLAPSHAAQSPMKVCMTNTIPHVVTQYKFTQAYDMLYRETWCSKFPTWNLNKKHISVIIESTSFQCISSRSMHLHRYNNRTVHWYMVSFSCTFFQWSQIPLTSAHHSITWPSVRSLATCPVHWPRPGDMGPGSVHGWSLPSLASTSTSLYMTLHMRTPSQ